MVDRVQIDPGCSPGVRGSVDYCLQSFAGPCVLPGCPGISRKPAASANSLDGAPRVSGDQSIGRSLSPNRPPCSPGVRGSVGDRPRRHRRGVVLPGCPGISRQPGDHPKDQGRAPRVSGDQSILLSWTDPADTCSPGVRGSVGSGGAAAVRLDVLPGCPGISRMPLKVQDMLSRAPRVSGDQSMTLLAPCLDLLCSPGVRGSVETSDDSTRDGKVLPGCPGISRQAPILMSNFVRAPRVSGDQSAPIMGQRRWEWCSPGVRGSVVHHSAIVSGRVVLPGCPGISRKGPAELKDRVRAPRVSGDQSIVKPCRQPSGRCSPGVRGSVDVSVISELQISVLPGCPGISRRGCKG